MGDRFTVEFNTYQRRFRQPLQTSHGIWRVREGIIVSLSDCQGQIGQGEIAPLPWFGSETLAEALTFCRQLNGSITREEIGNIPNQLPACQFAMMSALENLDRTYPNVDYHQLSYCHLLSPQQITPAYFASLPKQQYPYTFKWKIGIKPIETEIAEIKQLIQVLPADAKLRLDANGGLNLTQARKLLTVTDNLPVIEFIEQPLPPDLFTEMLVLSKDYSTPLALDESVANCDRLEAIYQAGWQSIFVLKAAIMGYPDRLRSFCQENSLDTVFSSVFETDIGRQAVLNLAATTGDYPSDTSEADRQRAVGFGVNHWF